MQTHKNVDVVRAAVDIFVLHVADAVAARVRADGYRKIGQTSSAGARESTRSGL